MVALGFALLWIGYTAALYGYILIRGYDIPGMKLFKSNWGGTYPNS